MKENSNRPLEAEKAEDRETSRRKTAPDNARPLSELLFCHPEVTIAARNELGPDANIFKDMQGLEDDGTSGLYIWARGDLVVVMPRDGDKLIRNHPTARSFRPWDAAREGNEAEHRGHFGLSNLIERFYLAWRKANDRFGELLKSKKIVLWGRVGGQFGNFQRISHDQWMTNYKNDRIDYANNRMSFANDQAVESLCVQVLERSNIRADAKFRNWFRDQVNQSNETGIKTHTREAVESKAQELGCSLERARAIRKEVLSEFPPEIQKRWTAAGRPPRN